MSKKLFCSVELAQFLTEKEDELAKKKNRVRPPGCSHVLPNFVLLRFLTSPDLELTSCAFPFVILMIGQTDRL